MSLSLSKTSIFNCDLALILYEIEFLMLSTSLSLRVNFSKSTTLKSESYWKVKSAYSFKLSRSKFIMVLLAWTYWIIFYIRVKKWLNSRLSFNCYSFLISFSNMFSSTLNKNNQNKNMILTLLGNEKICLYHLWFPFLRFLDIIRLLYIELSASLSLKRYGSFLFQEEK